MREIDTNRLLGFAREMRRNPTQAEKRLWYELQGSQTGAKFRRQMPLGPFIPDFVCPSARLIVEVDGDSHTNPGYDHRRDVWLRSQGWHVLRFSDIEVMESLESVVRVIRLAVMDPAFVVQEWSRERWSI